ncbi:MAG: hypothetical protein WBQ69_08735 [Gallionella sp.]
MKSVQLLIPDLFLPKDVAAEACAGLSLLALEKLLSRGHSVSSEPISLEALLCDCFDVAYRGDAPIASISASFDGLAAGCWMRADPVNLSLQRDRLLLAGVQAGIEEAAVLCASLNAHFDGQGMEFFAPHPQRWYLRLDTLPRIKTTPLSEVIGGDVRSFLPTGEDAMRWHQLFNGIQMLLHAHPLNEAREARGELPINSLWLWGAGGQLEPLRKIYDFAGSDDVLAEMFAAAADIPFAAMPAKWNEDSVAGRQLLVWTGLRSALQQGDLSAWQSALQDFENGYAQPLWAALRSGKIALVQLDIPGTQSVRSVQLRRADVWAFWRRSRRLHEYSSK